MGFGAAYGLHRRVHPFFQVLATFAAAYVAYFICEWLDWSGIFAVLATAMTMRELERRREIICMNDQVEHTWHLAATFANAALFLLVAASVAAGRLVGLWQVVLIVIGATLISRALVSYGLLAIRPKMIRSWKAVVRLAGVRGALSLALALGIPASLPDRGIVIDATFAVVIFTLLIEHAYLRAPYRQPRPRESARPLVHQREAHADIVRALAEDRLRLNTVFEVELQMRVDVGRVARVDDALGW